MSYYSNPWLSNSVMGVLLLACVGCTSPVNHVGIFSKATADLANVAAASYDVVNETNIQRQLSDIAVNPENFPTDDAFKKILKSSNLELRINLFRAVESYAKALDHLSNADLRQDVDSAAQDLYGALGSLQKHIPNGKNYVSDEHLAIIATVVESIGSAIVEEKRRQALKRIIVLADPAIQKAMNVLSEETPELSQLSLINAKTQYTNRIKAYQHESKQLPYDRRLNELNQIYGLYERSQNISGLFDNLIASSKKIAEAHANLKKLIESDQQSTAALVNDIKQLVAFTKSTQAFYNKLLSASH